MNGSKKYEFRKTIFDSRHISRVYIYCTAPVKKIVAVFEVGEIVEDEPKRLWENLGDSAGIRMEEFFAYFCDSEKGYAIGIRNLRRLDVPIDPCLSRDFTPPQSFCYVTSAIEES